MSRRIVGKILFVNFTKLLLHKLRIEVPRGHPLRQLGMLIRIIRTPASPQGIKQLLFGVGLRPARVGRANRVDEPVHVVAEHVVGGDGFRVVDTARVGLLDVVGLHEGLLGGLPVHRQALAHVGFDVAVLDVEVLEVLRQHAQKLLEGLGVVIEVDEHEPAPGAHPHGPQAVAVGAHVGEVPVFRQVDQLAVQVVLPAMKRAFEGLAETRGLRVAQRRAAVHAGVAERLDRAVLVAHHNGRQRANVVNVVVARLRDVLLPASHLPNPRPQLVEFRLQEFLGGVVGVGDVIVAHELVGMFQKRRRGRRRIPQYRLLIGRPRRTRLAGIQIGFRHIHASAKQPRVSLLNPLPSTRTHQLKELAPPAGLEPATR